MSEHADDSKDKSNISYGENPQGDGQFSNEEDECRGKLFIGGLSWQTTLEGLKYYFEKFGELTDSHLMTDKKTGQPKGFGFVRFKDAAGIL